MNTEVWGIRLRGWTRNGIRALGIVLVLLAAYNALVVPSFGTPVFAPYRMISGATGVALPTVDDVLLMTVGASLTWFV